VSETINQLQLDIAEMECAVLYYQNRIAWKRIAIEEIIQSAMVRDEAVADSIPEPETKPLVEIVGDVATAEFNGGDIDYKELRLRCVQRHPDQLKRFERGFYTACVTLIGSGRKIVLPAPRRKK
jgi:hypothetical protein